MKAFVRLVGTHAYNWLCAPAAVSLSLSEARTCFVGRYCLQCCFAHCLSHVTVGNVKENVEHLCCLRVGGMEQGDFFCFVFNIDWERAPFSERTSSLKT